MDIITRGMKSPEDRSCFEKCLTCKSWIRWRESEGNVASDPKTKARLNIVKCPVCGGTIKSETGK